MNSSSRSNWNGTFLTYAMRELDGAAPIRLAPPQRKDAEDQRNQLRSRQRRRMEEILMDKHSNPHTLLAAILDSQTGRMLIREDEEPALAQTNAQTRARLAEVLAQMEKLSGIEKLHPITVQVHCNGNYDTLCDPREGTTFGYVLDGTVNMDINGNEHAYSRGTYFSLNDVSWVRGDGQTILIQSRHAHPDHVGNIADVQHMEYLNGCRDAVLIAPLKIGEPCTNYLIVKPETTQDAHIHPSDRIGLVVDGSAICSIYQESPDGGRLPPRWSNQFIRKGDVFLLPAGNLHRFTTQKDPLTVFTFHPDSATDHAEENPMMLGTIRSADDADQWNRMSKR